MSRRTATPSIWDVAREVGVSHMTVARVFGGKGPVAEGTRARVLAAAARLGYRPNELARSLVEARTRTLGLVMNTGLWFQEVPNGVEETAQERGYSLISTRPRRESAAERERIETLRRRRVDGLLILSASDTAEHEHLRELHAEGVPLLTINRYVPEMGFTRVFFDYRGSTRAVARRLLAAGHRRIAFVGGSPEHPQQAVREHIAGYREVLQEAGQWRRDDEVFGGAQVQDGEALVEALLDRVPETTAIMAVNDPTAAVALRALRRRGRRVPADVAVIGCDDTPVLVECTDPPLTSIRHATYEAGKTGCRLLIDQCERPDDDARTLVLPSSLIIRQSCGLAQRPGMEEIHPLE